MDNSPRYILILNGGSSSLKFALFRSESVQGKAGLLRSLAGQFERIGQAEAQLKIVESASRQREQRAVVAPDHAACLEPLTQLLAEVVQVEDLAAIGHRIVHGGPHYHNPQTVTPALLSELRRISPYDPEHLPAEISLIEAFAQRHPQLLQIACFDTAFHAAMPRVAKLLPLPLRYFAQGVQRYGFHGLSYAFLLKEVERLAGPEAAQGRIILAHLGNGASMAAVRGGQSVETTMGFTPTAGLVMGSRSGDLDPGLVAYFAQTEGMSAEQFQHMVNSEAGMRGLSETSADMRDLLGRETTDERAADAVALFCYQAKKWIGALTTTLGGLDTLVFAGGIGEHAAPVRERICAGLEFLGINLDATRNQANAPVISSDESRVKVRVIKANEDLMIARHTSKIVKREINV